MMSHPTSLSAVLPFFTLFVSRVLSTTTASRDGWQNGRKRRRRKRSAGILRRSHWQTQPQRITEHKGTLYLLAELIHRPRGLTPELHKMKKSQVMKWKIQNSSCSWVFPQIQSFVMRWSYIMRAGYFCSWYSEVNWQSLSVHLPPTPSPRACSCCWPISPPPLEVLIT